MSLEYDTHDGQDSLGQGTSRRESLLREIRAAEARLGRLVLEAGIGLPNPEPRLRPPSDAERLATVLARKIQDLRRQIASG